MEITNIQQLIDLDKVYKGKRVSLSTIQKLGENGYSDPEHYIVYATNIFLTKGRTKNAATKYKNNKVFPCIVKIGTEYSETQHPDTGDYSLLVVGGFDIWDEYYRHSGLNFFEKILSEHRQPHIHRYTDSKGKPQVIINYDEWPHLHVFTTKKEAEDYIKDFRGNKDVTKFKTRLKEIDKQISELQSERQKVVEQLNKAKQTQK